MWDTTTWNAWNWNYLLAHLVGMMGKLRVTEAFKSAPSSPRMLFSCSFFGQISHVKNTSGHPCLFCPLLLREDLCLASTMLSRRSPFLSHSYSHHFSFNLPFPPLSLSLMPLFLLSFFSIIRRNFSETAERNLLKVSFHWIWWSRRR